MKKFFKQIFWDSTTRRLRTLWRLLLQIVLILILSGLGFALLSRGLAYISTASASARSEQTGEITGVVGVLLMMLLSIWLAGRFFDRRRFVDFGVHWNRAWWLDWAFGLSLGAVLMFLIFAVEWAAGWLTITGAFQTATPHTPFGRAILDPIILFFCVGIYEEFFSRGYQLKNLAEGFNGLWGLGPRGAVLVAMFVSAAVFGLLHAGNPNATWVSTFNIFLAGLFLALGYGLTGELALPIGLHIGWNFFQGNVFGFPVSGTAANATTFIAIHQGGNPLVTGGAFGPEAGLIGIAAMLLGSLLIVGWVRMHYGAARLQLRLAKPDLRFEVRDQRPGIGD
ncbi:MAG: CPBP family intramembrane glutamic endopeptidase [Caldilineaceae bacterium]